MNRTRQAYEYMKKKIEQSEWLAGQPIKEQDISQELGMSRTPVRQAFVQLEEENYIEHLDNKGVVVAPKKISKKDFQEAVEFFELMSLHYLQEIERKEIDYATSDLEEALQRMQEKKETGEGSDFLKAELEFWNEFLTYAGNDYNVSLMMQTLHTVFEQKGYIQDVIHSSQTEKIVHLSQLVIYLENNDYPYARRELRILFNQMIMNIFQGPAGHPF